MSLVSFYKKNCLVHLYKPNISVMNKEPAKTMLLFILCYRFSLSAKMFLGNVEIAERFADLLYHFLSSHSSYVNKF